LALDKPFADQCTPDAGIVSTKTAALQLSSNKFVCNLNGENGIISFWFREVKKSPSKKSPVKTKKEDESNPVEKKPKVEKVDDKITSKYFKDVKMEPLEQSESLQKIQKMKTAKKEKVVIKKEPIDDVYERFCAQRDMLTIFFHYRINQLVESRGEELQSSDASLPWHPAMHILFLHV
jgi:hypothetical protein